MNQKNKQNRMFRLSCLIGLGVTTGCVTVPEPLVTQHGNPALAPTAKLAQAENPTRQLAPDSASPTEPATVQQNAIQQVAHGTETDADRALLSPAVVTSKLSIPVPKKIVDHDGDASRTQFQLAASPIAVEAGFDPANNEGVDLAWLEATALNNHPQLAEARAQVQVARGQVTQAGLPFNPQLQYQSDEMGLDEASGLHSLTLSQQIVTANKLGINQQVQLQTVRQRQAELERAQLVVLTRLRTTYAQTLVAQRRFELNQRIVELAEKSAEAVNALFNAQEVSRIDLLQAQVEASQAKIAAENTATQLEASRRSLAAAAGLDALPGHTIAGEIASDLEEAPWDSLLADISASSPEIAAAGAQLERARWALQLACAQVTPNVTAQLGVGFDAVSDEPFARVGLSLPLPIRNRNQGNIRSARAQISAAANTIDRTQLDLNARLADAVGRYQVARERYLQLQNTVLPNAQETFELSQQAFQAGEATFLQLLTAQRTLFNVQLNILGAASNAMNASAEIEGMLVATQL